MSEEQKQLWQYNQVEGILEIQDGDVISINARASELLNIPFIPLDSITKESNTNLSLIAIVRNHKIEEAYLSQQKLEVSSQGRLLEITPCDIGLSIIDITEIRQTQQHARELLAVLSHELRTPVTTIRSTIEALHYDLSSEKRTNFLERAATEVDRLTRLLDDLTVDVKPPQLRRLNLAEHIDRATNLLQDKIEAHQITIDVAQTEHFVVADSDKLLQVLINLIENAVIHGPNSGTVKIQTTTKDSKLHVDVIDQGDPLDGSTIEQLFEPHSRGDSSKAKGTGLGLYIVRNIAKYWDGEAWGYPLDTLESDTSGNSFSFSVPLA